MSSVVGILLLALLGQSPQESDEILLKSGRTLRGLIEEENDEFVVLRIVVKGPKGETAVSGTTTVRRDEIAEIRRMEDAHREARKAKVEAFEDREWEREKRLAKIIPTPATVAGREGFVATGDLFEVFTTCDETFAQEACDILQQAYEGYLRHFKLRRRARSKLPVVILESEARYQEYLTERFGGAAPGSLGVYFTEENVIVSFNPVQREEEARIRKIVIGERRKIEEFRKEIREHEARVEEEAKAAKKRVVDEAAKAKAEIRRVDPANRPALLRKVDAWVADEFKRITEWKRGALDYLGGFRKRAKDGIDESHRIIAHNEMVLRNQNRGMFETLFHECFHAFVRNRLYTDKEIPRWLHEGMACYFEVSVMEAGELLHGAPNRERLATYRDAAAKRKLPALRSVLSGEDLVVEHEGHIDRAVTAYAVSWAVAHYLSGKMTRDQMDAYVAGVALGADPAEALEKVLRMPLPRIDEAVRAHVAKLK